MSRFTTRFGDILDSPTAKIICHQVNCIGVMGSGLALGVKKRYPEAFEEYKNNVSNLQGNCLGGCLLSKCNDGRYIAHLFGQYYYVADFPDDLDYLYNPDPWKAVKLVENGHKTIFTNYEALYRSLINLRDQKLPWLKDNPTIAFPVNLGCGRGGGEWSIVLEMIHSVFRETKNEIELWELTK